MGALCRVEEYMSLGGGTLDWSLLLLGLDFSYCVACLLCFMVLIAIDASFVNIILVGLLVDSLVVVIMRVRKSRGNRCLGLFLGLCQCGSHLRFEYRGIRNCWPWNGVNHTH